MTSIGQLYTIYLDHPVVSTDTRNIIPGSIFFALKGANFNGNTFALQALESGAAYAVIDEENFCLDERFLLVDDVLNSLQQLAHHHRRTLNIPVLGITGSNGKTTSKELINAVLSKKYRTLATKGNLNNHIGVPLTLLSITPDIEFAIIEMGANHQKEIEFLCRIAEPGYGLVSNVGKAHLEGMGGFEGVKKTKKELFDHIEQHGGIVFVNGDDDNLLGMAAKVDTKILYGSKPEFAVSGQLLHSDPLIDIEFRLAGSAEKYRINSMLVGDYNLANILAAVCIGHYFSVPVNNIVKGIEAYEPSNNRSQVIRKGSNTIIMDAYNANPSSMAAALTNFSRLKAPNKYLILGDMFELGDESLQEHLEIIEQTQALQFKNVLFVGKEFYHQQKYDHLYFKTTAEVIAYLQEHPVTNSTILIKGSRGMKLETALDEL